jgi:2-polyprenyl-6-hydroxyphenyl methylase/3-demethylubiquinone-9 3-methyltransferase
MMQRSPIRCFRHSIESVHSPLKETDVADSSFNDEMEHDGFVEQLYGRGSFGGPISPSSKIAVSGNSRQGPCHDGRRKLLAKTGFFIAETQSMPIDRTPDAKELTHERMGDAFELALSGYDTARRVEVLIDHFLTDVMVRGKSALDVGCGLGFFSERLARRGARVLATDLGPGLVERTRERVGCEAQVADALRLADQFGPDRFDLVVSSECIEHTPNPREALLQMVTVLKPGGYIAISTPNVIWYPAVKLSTMLKIRPFDGFENFSTWRSLRSTLREGNVEVVQEVGLHLFPFQFGAHRFSRWCDANLQGLRTLMINLCILGRKRPAD